MKWHRWEDKLPELGTNIMVCFKSDHEVYLGIRKFDLVTKDMIIAELTNNGCNEYCKQYYFCDNPEDDSELDIVCSTHWSYISSIKLPKKMVSIDGGKTYKEEK